MKKIITMISIFFIAINTIYAKERVKFSKCIDGDTFSVIIDNEKQKIRLLAVDTPEIAKEKSKPDYYGKEASDYTCKKLTKAKKIEIEYDEKSDKFDKYNRLLAWVFIDGKLLQEDLIENGYAKIAYLYSDYKYVDLLKEKQELASAKNIGVWNEQAKKQFNPDAQEEEKSSNIEVVALLVLFLIITLITKIFTKKK